MTLGLSYKFPLSPIRMSHKDMAWRRVYTRYNTDVW